MIKTTMTILTLLAFSALYAAETKIAIISSYEIIDLIKVKVLAKPENAEAKKTIAEIEKKTASRNEKLSSALQNEATRDAAMAELVKANNEKEEVEKSIESQVQAEYVKTLKEFIKGKYSVVLNSDYVNEAIVTKDAELADITIDIKEYLLVK
jgi:Rps23 Pro-64 3,4-dihydroxylase Tpa1-like proline 4-hydroxylase